MVLGVGPNQVSKGSEGTVVGLDSFHVFELLLAFGLRVSDVLSSTLSQIHAFNPLLGGQ